MPAANPELYTSIKAGPGQGRPLLTFQGGTPATLRNYLNEVFGLDQSGEHQDKSLAELTVIATLTYSQLFDRYLTFEPIGKEVQELPAEGQAVPLTTPDAPKRSGRGRLDNVSKALWAVHDDPEGTYEQLKQVYRDNADKWNRDKHGALAEEIKQARGWE